MLDSPAHRSCMWWVLLCGSSLGPRSTVLQRAAPRCAAAAATVASAAAVAAIATIATAPLLLLAALASPRLRIVPRIASRRRAALRRCRLPRRKCTG